MSGRKVSMGVMLALCLAATTASAQVTGRRTYSSPIEWSPSIKYARSYYGNAKKKYILVYIGSEKEKREPRTFMYAESVNASRTAWLFVDLNHDPDDPWQKRWGVKRAPTVVGCDIHGNAFNVTPSLSRAGLKRTYALVPVLIQKYEATLKRDLGAAIAAIDSNPDKAVRELVRLVREGHPGYPDVKRALDNLEEIAKPEFARGELAESVGPEHASEFYAGIAARFEGTPPGARARLRQAELEVKRGRFDEAVRLIAMLRELDSRIFPTVQASALALLEEVAAGPTVALPDSGRHAVPDDEPLARSARLYREIFTAVPDPADRAAMKLFARTLLDKAVALENRPVGTYYLLSEARETGVKAADAATAVEAIVALSERFEGDRTALINRTLQAIDRMKLTVAESGVLAGACIQASKLLMHDDPDAALACLETGALQARKAKDLSLIGEVRRRNAGVKAFKAIADRARSFVAVLAKDPDNAEANLEVGRFRCLHQDKWDEGLPMLAKGNDAALQKAAAADLADPQEPAEQIVVGDGWWDLAEKNRDTRSPLLVRAGGWYVRAWPFTLGPDRLKVEQRIQSIVKEVPDAGLALPEVAILTEKEFNGVAERFPASANLATKGTATASSQYSARAPGRVFRGKRSGTAWSLEGPQGWFEAGWDPPAVGRTILLFGREASAGNDSWGEASVVVNGTITLKLAGMAGSTVAVIDLGIVLPIRSLRIEIDGTMYPGLAGLEIHP